MKFYNFLLWVFKCTNQHQIIRKSNVETKKKIIHLSYANSFIKKFCQTNKVQMNKDNIVKYWTLEPNLWNTK